jgi:hypothetical protein
MRQTRQAFRYRQSHRNGFRKNGRPHPNHHLWRNGRLWWIAFTVHKPDWTAEPIRGRARLRTLPALLTS